jgi:exodeoxyribonuclease V gamma subunit
MLTLVHSNSMQALAERLAERLAGAAADVLEPEVVVVPSAGVARWLKYRLAERHGVCANVEFPYPAQFIWRLFASLLPEVPDTSPFDASVMTWRLYGLLGRLSSERPDLPPAFGRLHAYLTRSDARGRLELASRIAALFDQYLVYRPDWLQRWAAAQAVLPGLDEDEAWQAALWRELLRLSGARPGPHPKEAFFARLAEAGAAAALPQRISLFAVPVLPPLYLEIFARLARHVDVVVHVLNPCAEFWTDIVAERELARLALQGETAAAYRDVGQPLLASWGRQARDNLALLSVLGGEDDTDDVADFRPPAGDTLLRRLQRAIVELSDLDGAALPLAAGDRSLQVHACHSLTRQLEVLHDQLLDLFQARPDLRPGDVVVMTPDLDAAAPLVDAVFGAAPRQRFIPYAVTGRARPDASPLVRAFDALLGLPSARFEAAALFDLLQTPPLARRFDLQEDDLERIRTWLQEAGVRWGRDAGHRAELGLPREARHTWAEGLARLLLGYALPGEGQRLHAGLLPLDDLEGSQALALGRLARFIAQAAVLAGELAQPRPMAEWAATLTGLVGRLFAPGEREQPEAERLRAAIVSLAESAGAAGLNEALPVAVVRAALQDVLAANAPGAVPAGGVTFCGIGTLRGLPYRVVCLLGLDDGAFPRTPAALEFDLMARRPRLGDRARRDDDRGSFLDALMAAGDVFYLSYTGRSQRDNAPLPPSVLVTELLDYLGRCVAGGRAALQARLVTEHPLQPFSRRYFSGELFSYADEYLAAARAAAAPGPAAAGPLIAAPLPPAQAEWRRVDLDRLLRFLRHPVRYLLRERLRIELAQAEEELSDVEPFLLERPAAWRLGERLLRLRLGGASGEEMRGVALAGGELPHGVVGEIILARELEEVNRFAALLERLRPAQVREPLPFEFVLGEFTLCGTLAGLHAGGLFGQRLARRGAADLLEAWLGHLVLNHLGPAGGRVTTWLNQDLVTELAPLPDAAAHLAVLLELYWQGLHTPLPFPPRSALALVFEGPARAAATWCGNDFQPGEAADPWYRLAYGGVLDALPAGFEETAAAVLGPLRALCREQETGMLGAPAEGKP